MIVCTDGGNGHCQWQDHCGEPTPTDREEPKQLGRDMLGLKADVHRSHTHEDGVGNPVDCHESAGKNDYFRLNVQETKR